MRLWNAIRRYNFAPLKQYSACSLVSDDGFVFLWEIMDLQAPEKKNDHLDMYAIINGTRRDDFDYYMPNGILRDDSFVAILYVFVGW